MLAEAPPVEYLEEANMHAATSMHVSYADTAISNTWRRLYPHTYMHMHTYTREHTYVMDLSRFTYVRI